MRRSVLFLVLLAGCEPATDPDAVDMATWPDVAGCEHAPAEGTDLQGGVRTEVLPAGTFANAIVIDDAGVGWVVNSGDNTIARFDVDDPQATWESAFIDVGQDRNPYDVVVDGDRIFVANFIEGSITVADRATGAVLETRVLDALVSPQDIVAIDDLVVVASTGFTAPLPDGRYGSVVVLDRESLDVRAELEPTGSNPQFLHVADGMLYAVSSGGTVYDAATGRVTPRDPSAVDAWPLDALTDGAAPLRTWDLGIDGLVGNAGRPAQVGARLFMGSGTAPVLFEIDLDTGEVVHGAADPLWLRPDDGTNGLVAPYTGPDEGLLTVLDFNRDALVLFDVDCRRVVSPPVDLGTTAEMLEGPADLATDAEGTTWVVMTLSSAITTWR